MFLTKIKFSPKDVKKEKIYDQYGLHKIIYKIFSGYDRILYADKGMQKSERIAIVLSDEAPDIQNYNMEIKKIPESFLKLGIYNFQIDINPVKRITAINGKIVSEPIKDYDKIAEWFANKSEKWGFKTSVSFITVNDITVFEFKKNDGNTVTINSANISGVLKVTNEKLFEKSFRNGLGRSKAYGHGLLQLVPVNIF